MAQPAIPGARRLQDAADARMGVKRPADQQIVSTRGYANTAAKTVDNIAKARLAGYSDEAIVEVLAEADAGVARAKAGGYAPAAILSTLAEVHTGQPYADRTFTAGNRAELDRGARGREARAAQAAGPRGLARVGADMKAGAPFSLAQTFATGGPAAMAGAAALNTVGGAVNAFNAPFGRLAERSGVPAAVVETPLNVLEAFIPGGGTTRAASGANALSRPAAAVNALAKAVPDVAAARQLAASKNALGIDAALVDVLPAQGRDLVGAAALRNTPGRQAAIDFAQARTEGAPGRVSSQARAVVSSDPRTPLKIAEDLGAARKTQADAQYGAVRGEQVALTPEATTALRSDYGRQAIREAAARERDADTKRALMGLADQALDQPGAPVTVGMMDRVSRVLFSKAQAAARTGDNDLAATFTALGQDVRRAATDVSPGYGEAISGYKAQSDLIESAGRGEDFLKRNTDEFVADATAMSPDQRELARATARRAVESASGENISAAPGVMRKLAYAPEQLQRNNALLGVDDALALQERMKAELDALDAARAVNPRTGSPTTPRLIDQEALNNIGDAAEAATHLVSGNRRGVITIALRRLKTLGLNDRQAEEVVRLATDPSRLDEALSLIEAAKGRTARQSFVGTLRNLSASGRNGAAVGRRAGAATNQLAPNNAGP